MAELKLWQQIYSLCDELFSLKPWTILYEDDLFAVESPESGNVYFISIMGSNEEVYALAAYEGAEALYQFWDLHNGEIELPPENIMLIPHMMVSLDNRENIPEKQRSVIKQLGLKYRGKQAWPNIERIIPAYLPDIPDDSLLHDLVFILEQSIHIIKRATKNKDLIYNETHHEDEYLFREAKTDNGQRVWKDVYKRVPVPTREEKISYSKDKLNSFKKLPEGKNELEMDFVMIPAPTKEKGGAPYFPFVLIIVDPNEGMILDFEMLSPQPDFPSMLSRLPDTIFEKFIKTGKRPGKISYKSPYIEGIMGWIEKETEQEMEQRLDLPVLDDAVGYLIDSMKQ